MIENILNVNGIDYKISSPEKLTEEQIELLKTQIMSDNAKVVTLSPAICAPDAKTTGSVVTMKSTPTGGTAPYTVKFKKNNVDLTGGTFTGVGEGVLKTFTYTVVSADKPQFTLSVVVTDSCVAGSKSCTEECIVRICDTPVCNFEVS